LKEEVERLRTHTAGLEAQLALVLEKREGEKIHRNERERLQKEVRSEGGREGGREDEHPPQD